MTRTLPQCLGLLLGTLVAPMITVVSPVSATAPPAADDSQVFQLDAYADVSLPPVLEARASVRMPVPAMLGPAADPLVALTSALDSVEGVVDDVYLATLPVLPGPLASALGTVRDIVDLATYRVCWQSAKYPDITCSTNVLLGTPVSVDVAGNLFPDVTARLSPTATPGRTPYQPRFGANFELSRLIFAPSPLKAHVFAVVEIPFADKRIQVGFGDPDTELATKTVAQASIADVFAVAAGAPLDVDVSLTHTAPGPSGVVSVGTSTLLKDGGLLLPGGTEDPDLTSLRFTPVPAAPAAITARVTLDTNVDNDAILGDNLYRASVSMPSAAILDVTRLERKGRPGQDSCCGYTDLRAHVEKLAKDVTVTASTAENGSLAVDYAGSATTDLVTMTRTAYPAVKGVVPTAAEAATRTTITARAESIPKAVHFSYADATTAAPGTVQRSTRIEYAGDQVVGKVSATMEKVNNGVVDSRFLASVRDIPTAFTANLDETRITTNLLPNLTRTRVQRAVEYAADGEAKNLHVETLDHPGNSAAVVDVATLPRYLKLDTDLTPPVDTIRNSPGCEEPGSTRVHLDARSGPTAPAGSGSLGQIAAQVRSGVAGFLDPGTTAPSSRLFVQTADPSPVVCGDESLRADLRYDGLSGLDVNLDPEDINFTLRNTARRDMALRADTPDLRIGTNISQLAPKTSVSYHTTGDSSSIKYTGCTPAAGGTCTPTSVPRVQARVEGVGSGGPFRADEFVDAEVTDVPASIQLDVATPAAAPGKVTFQSSERVTKVVADVVKNVPEFGDLVIHGVISGIPSRWALGFGENAPITLTAGQPGQPEVIDSVAAAITNTGGVTTLEGSHAHVKFAENDDGDSTPNESADVDDLEASIAVNAVKAFSVDPSGGNLRATFDTGLKDDEGTLVNANPSFVTRIAASAILGTTTYPTEVLGVDGNPITVTVKDPSKRLNIQGSATLAPLPTHILVTKTGGATAAEDTSSLRIDTAGGGDYGLAADLVIGHPDAIEEALKPANDPGSPEGVSIGDAAVVGCTACTANRIKLSLPKAPSYVRMDYGRIKQEPPTTGGPTRSSEPAIDVHGLNTQGGKLVVAFDLDDNPDPAANLEGTVAIDVPAAGVDFALHPLQLRSAASTFGRNNITLHTRAAASVALGRLKISMIIGSGDSRKGIKMTLEKVTTTTDFDLSLKNDAATTSPPTLQAKGSFGPDSSESPGFLAFDYFASITDAAPVVDLDLDKIPGSIDFQMLSPNGGPVPDCFDQKAPTPRLPLITYKASGIGRDGLVATGYFDLKKLANDPNVPNIRLDLDRLAHNFAVQPAGNHFLLGPVAETGVAASGKVGVTLEKFNILDVDYDFSDPDCAVPDGLSAIGTMKMVLSGTAGLELTGLKQADLIPGLSTGVKGDFTSLKLSITGAHAWFNSSGLGVRVKRTPDPRFDKSLPMFSNPTIEADLPIYFHKAKNKPGPWIHVNTSVLSPGCPFAVVTPPPLFWALGVDVDLQPAPGGPVSGEGSITVGAPTDADGSAWVITADPFKAGRLGTAVFNGIDLIDTLAGLTSPYDPKGPTLPLLTGNAYQSGVYLCDLNTITPAPTDLPGLSELLFFLGIPKVPGPGPVVTKR